MCLASKGTALSDCYQWITKEQTGQVSFHGLSAPLKLHSNHKTKASYSKQKSLLDHSKKMTLNLEPIKKLP